jgi:hypothetical protein
MFCEINIRFILASFFLHLILHFFGSSECRRAAGLLRIGLLTATP